MAQEDTALVTRPRSEGPAPQTMQHPTACHVTSPPLASNPNSRARMPVRQVTGQPQWEKVPAYHTDNTQQLWPHGPERVSETPGHFKATVT